MRFVRWWRSLFGTDAPATWRPLRPHRRGDLAVALLVAAVRCVAWGLLAGSACGAVAGTVVLPGIGTVYGAWVGTWVGAGAAVVVTPIVLGVLLRHRRGLGAFAALRATAAAIVGVLELVPLGALVVQGRDVDPLGVLLWLGLAVVATTAALIGILRLAAPSIAAGWYRSLGLRPVLEGQVNGSVRLPLENAR